MLNDVKKVLGLYNTNAYDSIIQNLINAIKMDLIHSGIVENRVVETDSLIYSAIMSGVLSLFDTYEYRELSANAYILQKDQLRHYADYIS